MASYVLLGFYDGGDQVHYRSFYSKVKDAPFFQALVIAHQQLGAGEPISIFILWLGSYLGFEKDLYISFLNVILAYSVFKFSVRGNLPFFVIALIVLNFYFLVLLTGAERLKIAYIFLVFAVLSKGNYRFIFFFISCLAHFQVFLLAPSILLYTNFSSLVRFFRYQKLNKKLAIVLFLGGVMSLVVFGALYSIVISKMNAYFSIDRSLLELINLVLLSLVGVLSTSNYKRFVFSVSPFFLFVLLFGGDRVNMLAVTFLLGILVLENRMLKPLPLALMIYFAIKAVPFVENILEKGNGFA